MNIFNLIKRKKKKVEVKKTPKQVLNITQVRARHQTRIDSLLDEAKSLSSKLVMVEEDEEMQKSKKVKISDMIVQRLTHIKYEVGIRENLISWL